MLFEHWIYSLAIAIIAGMVHFRRTGRDYSWIIIASAYAPDLDAFAGHILNKFDANIFINPIKHGDFHNIAVLLIFACAVALVLRVFRCRFVDSFIFAGIGFGAHLFEDALVSKSGYAFLWPITNQVFGIGILENRRDLYGIANTETLIAGVIAILIVGCIRAVYENGGVKRIGKAIVVGIILMILIIPIFGLMNINLIEKVAAYEKIRYIDKWRYIENASWDNSVFHSGSYSGKIEIMRNESNITGEWRSDIIPIKQNTTYIFSTWGKTENIGGKNVPSIGIVELNISGRWINQTRLIFNGTNDWIKKEATFRPRNGTINVFVYVGRWNGYGIFWFDDVELHEKGDDVNLIPDSGLEMGAEGHISKEFEI
ncbi:MAG: hypothetical protein C3F06_13070 [Candidatus Methanoperedenaceae archaeon]|nr:MAG: hypothetical protein C3F06_13070 [Candidatus Methanoperedenaceae archaeon]